MSTRPHNLQRPEKHGNVPAQYPKRTCQILTTQLDQSLRTKLYVKSIQKLTDQSEGIWLQFGSAGDEFRNQVLHPWRTKWTQFGSPLKQSLLPGVQLPVQRKKNIEITGEQRGNAMVGADGVFTLNGLFNLVQI